jgi:hypothetical protein
MRQFESAWEIEYICSRVKNINEAVKNGNCERALDYLNMIQEKAKIAENMIKKEYHINM